MSKEDRPPYVVFEVKSEEDRAASIASGRYSVKDVDYAIITPIGSKDRIERRADEWLEQMREQSGGGRSGEPARIPASWYSHFQGVFDHWKKGQEAPINGTAIKNWPAASPAQVKLLLNAHVTCVEDLAQANEEIITRIGMGGRDLKAKAQAWLAASADTGKVAEEINALRVQYEQAQAKNVELQMQVTQLAVQLEKFLNEQDA
jgi:hypothetical protein